MRRSNVGAWKTSRGKFYLLKYLSGERITKGQAIIAKCAECCAGYQDGRVDCGINTCPLYGYMPYRNLTEECAEPDIDASAFSPTADDEPEQNVGQ